MIKMFVVLKSLIDEYFACNNFEKLKSKKKIWKVTTRFSKLMQS